MELIYGLMFLMGPPVFGMYYCIDVLHKKRKQRKQQQEKSGLKLTNVIQKWFDNYTQMK